MDEPGSIFLFVFLLLASIGGLVWLVVRPCWTPAITQRQRRDANNRSHASAAVGASSHAFSPLGAEDDSAATGAADDPSLEWARHGDRLHAYRSYVAFTALQAVLLLLFGLAVGLNRWSSVFLESPNGSIDTPIEIRLGLTNRVVHHAPAGSDDDPRYASGRLAHVCKDHGGLVGCAFTVQGTGGLVLVHALVALASLFLVFAYLLFARSVPKLSTAGFGLWVWRLCLLQALCTIAAPMIWLMCAHGFLASSSSRTALDASFFLALFVGLSSVPFLYCLRIALILLDSPTEVRHWGELSLLEHEMEPPPQFAGEVERPAAGDSAAASAPSSRLASNDSRLRAASTADGVDLELADLERPDDVRQPSVAVRPQAAAANAVGSAAATVATLDPEVMTIKSPPQPLHAPL